MTNTYCVYTVLRYSWWWTVDLSEICRVLYQINLRNSASRRLSLSKHSNCVKLLLEKNIYKKVKNQQEYSGADFILSGILLGVCALETSCVIYVFISFSDSKCVGFRCIDIAFTRLCGNWKVFIGAKLLTIMACIYLLSSRSIRVPQKQYLPGNINFLLWSSKMLHHWNKASDVCLAVY